jgi:hypothetical protein
MFIATRRTSGINLHLIKKSTRPKVVRGYQCRYGISWDELEILQVPIDPEYKERVLQTAVAQAVVKRRKRSRLRAQWADV